MVDWDLAVRVGSRLVGEGPEVTRAEAVEAVEELRAGRRAVDAAGPRVHRTGRQRAHGAGARRRPPGLGAGQRRRLRHGDRAARSTSSRRRRARPAPLTEAIGSRITGVELGAMLGFLGSKVLGQFDPFHDKPGEQGRLLLVAPNIVHVERELRRRPARLPALGVPARGDPPGAVHRGAVDDRPPALGDGLDHRRRADRPVRAARRRGHARSATWSPASPTAACSTCSPAPSRRPSSSGSPA